MKYEKRKVVNYLSSEAKCFNHMMINATYYFDGKWYCDECKNKLVEQLGLEKGFCVEEEIKPKVEKVGGENGNVL